MEKNNGNELQPEQVPIKKESARSRAGTRSRRVKIRELSDEQTQALLQAIQKGLPQYREAAISLREAGQIMSQYAQTCKAILSDPRTKEIHKSFLELAQNMGVIVQEISKLKPFFDALQEETKKPEYKGLSAEELEALAEEDPEQYADLWERAKAAAWQQSGLMTQDPEGQQDGSGQEHKQTAREKAIEKGAIMTLNDHLTTFSGKTLQDSLTGYKLFLLPDTPNQDNIFSQDGQVNALMLNNKEALSPFTEVHTALLMFIARSLSLGQSADSDGTVTFYVPTICRELGIDPRNYSGKREAHEAEYKDQRAQALISLIKPLENIIGVTPGGSYYRTAAFMKWDKESDTITIAAPYIQKIVQHAQALEGPQDNELFHADIMKERNHAAVELAARILTGVLQRGSTLDINVYGKELGPIKKKTVTKKNKDGTTTKIQTEYNTEDKKPKKKEISYVVTYYSLIKDCPNLLKQLENIKSPRQQDQEEQPERKKNWRQAYNSKLKQTFEAAYRIIWEKSDARLYYNNLTFEPINQKTGMLQPPTFSTLGAKIKISHTGKNKDYIPRDKIFI